MFSKFARFSLLLLASQASFIATADISQALQHEVRTEANKVRDDARKPEQTLRFFGVTPQSTVVEIWPGAGWYTEVLAPLLAEQGKLYAAHFSDAFTLLNPQYMQSVRSDYSKKLASHPVYQNVTVTEFAPIANMTIAPPESADFVLSIRNQFYIFEGEQSLRHGLASFYQALKPGGVLGVVAPLLPEDKLETDWQGSGYVPKQLWLELAAEAGFHFEASSDLLHNPKDTADHPDGIWSLPPALAGGDTDREKYLAIGEAHQMVLRFRKPLR